ncbi:MAG: hypothetical protein P4M15_07930 [Alphaproteobacteria bacterium]|nr:hypothetical protein [Alphaproteobacteria bacterium]
MAAKRLMRQEEMLARRNDYNQPANAAANLSDVDMAPVLAIMEKPDTTGNIAYQSVLLLQALFVVMPDKLTAPDVTAALDIVAARSDHAGAQAAALLKNVTHYRVRTTKAAPVEALFGLDPR